MNQVYELLIVVAVYIILFLIRNRLKSDEERKAAEARLYTISSLASTIVSAVEDIYKNNPELKAKISKLEYAINLFIKELEKQGITISSNEAELYIRSAYQESPYAK